MHLIDHASCYQFITCLNLCPFSKEKLEGYIQNPGKFIFVCCYFTHYWKLLVDETTLRTG